VGVVWGLINDPDSYRDFYTNWFYAEPGDLSFYHSGRRWNAGWFPRFTIDIGEGGGGE